MLAFLIQPKMYDDTVFFLSPVNDPQNLSYGDRPGVDAVEFISLILLTLCPILSSESRKYFSESPWKQTNGASLGNQFSMTDVNYATNYWSFTSFVQPHQGLMIYYDSNDNAQFGMIKWPKCTS